jgi:hypothetical protein
MDRDRLVSHLRGTLLREVRVGDQRLLALAEAPGQGGLFGAAANAQAAELLAQPEIRNADPAFADGVLDFVMAMVDQPLPCRHAVAGSIQVLRDDPRDFEILTPFHRFSGDLSAGLVRQQLLGNADALLLHSGNLVEFRLDRHRNGVDAEDTISHFALRRTAEGVTLMHESRITGTAGLLRARQVEAGTLRYEYEIRTGSPLLRVTVGFTAAPRRRISRLRVTTAVDQLGTTGLDMAEGLVGKGQGDQPGWRDFGAPKLPGLSVWADATPVPHLVVGRAGWPQGAAMLHIRPVNAAGVLSVKAVAAQPGALHWLILRHGAVDLPAGGSFVVQEHRLLTAGGTAVSGAAGMAAALRAGSGMLGLDLDGMPPSGAALNAVATQLLMATHGTYLPSLGSDRIATLTAWFERHMAALQAGEPGIADLALATLAAEARHRAGAGDAPLGILLQRLLARQDTAGTFEEEGQVASDPAAHALAILAMARSLPYFEPALLAGPMARALSAVRPGPVQMLDGARSTPVDGLSAPGAAPMPLQDHARALGLLLRAAAAVGLVAEGFPGVLPEEAVTQAQFLHREALALIRPLVRPREAALEVLPSPLGGEANPAGQAAVALGLMAPEAAILRLLPMAA